MRVFRRTMPNGNLTPAFYVHYEVEGKRVIKSTGCTTEREALKVARDMVAPLRKEKSARALVERHRQLLTGADSVALADAWGRFAVKPKAIAVGERQQGNNHARWADFVAFMVAQFPGILHLAAVTSTHAKAYLSHVRQHGRFSTTTTYLRGRREVKVSVGERQLSPRSLNAVHDTCKMVFAELAAEAGIFDNPFAAVPRLKAEYETREAFTLVEVRLLYERADEFLRPLILIGCTTGLRLGDCATLRWQEVDLNLNVITRRMSKTGRVVEVPIFEPRFRAWLVNQRANTAPDAEHVLPAQAAMYAENPDGLSYRMKALLAAVGLAGTEKVKGRTRAVSRRDWHSMRHAFLTLAAANGVPPHLLRQLAGHADLSMTARYVDHEDLKLLRARLNGMEILPLALDTTPAPAPSADELRIELAKLAPAATVAQLLTAVAALR